MPTDVPTLNDVIVGELAEWDRWVVASISGRLSWPTKAQKVQFRGATIFVVPVTKDHYPALAIRLRGGLTREDAQRIVMGLLSAICWIEDEGALVEHWTRTEVSRVQWGGRARPSSTCRTSLSQPTSASSPSA